LIWRGASKRTERVQWTKSTQEAHVGERKGAYTGGDLTFPT
jgi:hypothetical protein